MSQSVAIDMRDITITPIFKHLSLEDVAASEQAGRAIMVTHEVVEVRFAGHKNYSPVFPVSATWKREGLKVITYAERWADQYAAFLSGNAQIAAGTALEMLRPYGISEAQLSVCRALKVYSIEALHSLEGPNLKNLGMAANDLKAMADRFMAERNDKNADKAMIADLQRQINDLKSTNAMVIPVADPTRDEQEAAIEAADDEAQQLRDRYKAATGHGVRGRVAVEGLRQMVAEAEAAAAQ